MSATRSLSAKPTPYQMEYQEQNNNQSHEVTDTKVQPLTNTIRMSSSCAVGHVQK